MTTLASPPPSATPPPPPADRSSPGVLLRGINWGLYDALVQAVGDQNIRMTYDRGALEIMPPLPIHERWSNVIGRLLESLTVELNIPMEGLGRTTFRREDLERGLEPDECYYVEHAAHVRDKDTLDLTVDPPPDLVVEVDITSRSIPKLPIYAALGVPEVWRFDHQALTCLHLGPDGEYHPSPTSRAFPALRPADLLPF